jgi:hypothetical protein
MKTEEKENKFEQYLRLRCLELAFKALELNVQIGNNNIIEDAEHLYYYIKINHVMDDDEQL